MKVHALKVELVTAPLSIARVDLIAIILRARVVGVLWKINQLQIARKINLKGFNSQSKEVFIGTIRSNLNVNYRLQGRSKNRRKRRS